MAYRSPRGSKTEIAIRQADANGGVERLQQTGDEHAGLKTA
jgi:hypothetical protein